MAVKMIHRFTLLIISALALLIFDSCKKEEDDLPPPEPVPEKGFLAVCEGNFNWGNASITSYDENKDLLTNNYFDAVNGFTLGDVAQSIAETNDRYFIVVNNSSKIEVVDKSDFSSLYTITGLGSPRYFQAINDSIAYVSDLWNNAIHIVNYNTGNLVGDIAVNGWSEQMTVVDDSVYVCLSSSKSIGIINKQNNEIVHEIELNLSPSTILKDKNDFLYVLASNFADSSALYRIDPTTRTIVYEMVFSIAVRIKFIDLPLDSDQLYVVYDNGDFYRFGITQYPVITSMFSKDLNGMYGLNVNEEGELYVMEAHDFVQNGTITKYNAQGDTILSVESGINPSSLIFR